MAIRFKNEKEQTVESGDTVYLKLTVPEEKNMPVGRLDKIIDTLQKKNMIEIISETKVRDTK